MPVRVNLPDGRVVNFPDSMSPAEITHAIEGLQVVGPPEPPAPEPRSLGGFAENIVNSGGRFLRDTVQGVGSLAKNAAKILIDPEGTARDLGSTLATDGKELLHAAGEGLKNRYGGVEQIKNTLYTDPVGVLGDVSALASGGELAAARLPRIAKAMGTISRVTNPLTAVGAIAEPVLSGTANRIVRGTLRPPAAVRADFGGAEGVADAVLNNRVYSEASAQRKLTNSTAKADQLIADAEAAGVPGVPRMDVARSVIGEPAQTATLRTRLGVPDANPELMGTAKAVLRNNPREIPLTEAQAMKREAQKLAYEAGADNLTVKKAAEQAKARALRGGIEQRVPEVGPVNRTSQELIGAQQAFQAAEDRPRALTNFLSVLGAAGGGATGGPFGALGVPLAIKALDSPRAGAMLGIGLDTVGKTANLPEIIKAALLARLIGGDDQP